MGTTRARSRPSARPRTAAQGDGLAHEGRVDLVDDTVQADRAVVLDPALLFEEKQLVEVALRGYEADVVGRHHPAIEGCDAVEPAMRAHVVLALDPGPQAPVERVEALEIARLKQREELKPDGPEPPLDFPFGTSCRLHPMRAEQRNASA